MISLLLVLLGALGARWFYVQDRSASDAVLSSSAVPTSAASTGVAASDASTSLSRENFTVTVTSTSFVPSPSSTRDAGTVRGPVIDEDFADPGLIFFSDNETWYAYSTTSAHGNIPCATSSDFRNWTLAGDALPTLPGWVDSGNAGIWAPDVRQVTSGYIMYFTGYSSSDENHCIGVATSSSPEGPFLSQTLPIICNSSAGGVIDASGFEDTGGALYVVWKVDGNSLGHSTPILIQSVESDGYTLKGSATQLITNDAADGGVTEAPSLVLWAGWYYIFFSSNSYNTHYYDVSYATAKSATGPFTKSATPLLQSGKCSTAGPGGATVLNLNSVTAT